jgi:hypothetical protein
VHHLSILKVPDNFVAGPEARASIDGTFESGGDYLCVVIPPDFTGIPEDTAAGDFE